MPNMTQYAILQYLRRPGDDQQNLKYIIDYAMVSTTKKIIDDSHIFPMTSTPVKKPSTGKSLCLFTNIFDVKSKTEKRRVRAAKSKRRSMQVGNSLWTNKTK